MKFELEGKISVNTEIEAESAAVAVRECRRLYPGVRIDVVGDEYVNNWCEHCEGPILEGQDFESYADGVTTHVECP